MIKRVIRHLSSALSTPIAHTPSQISSCRAAAASFDRSKQVSEGGFYYIIFVAWQQLCLGAAAALLPHPPATLAAATATTPA